MTNEIERRDIEPQFWKHKKLQHMTPKEWESLCDGCGKCCMNKLEDSESGEVEFTTVACRLFDDTTCLCACYPIRHQFVPNCVVLRPSNIAAHLYWLPQTCAYRLIYENKPLYSWHPLNSGSQETVHAAGVSMQDKTIPEFAVTVEHWEDYIIEEPI